MENYYVLFYSCTLYPLISQRKYIYQRPSSSCCSGRSFYCQPVEPGKHTEPRYTAKLTVGTAQWVTLSKSSLEVVVEGVVKWIQATPSGSNTSPDEPGHSGRQPHLLPTHSYYVLMGRITCLSSPSLM